MIRFLLLVATLVTAGCVLFVGAAYVIASYGWTGVVVIVAWIVAAVCIVAVVNVGASAEGQGRRPRPYTRSQDYVGKINRRTS